MEKWRSVSGRRFRKVWEVTDFEVIIEQQKARWKRRWEAADRRQCEHDRHVDEESDVEEEENNPFISRRNLCVNLWWLPFLLSVSAA